MQRLTTFTQPTFMAELFPFVFSSIEIVSALSITLIPFVIMSQNLVEI